MVPATEPSTKLSSAVDAVIPSNVLSSAAVAVTPKSDRVDAVPLASSCV